VLFFPSKHKEALPDSLWNHVPSPGIEYTTHFDLGDWLYLQMCHWSPSLMQFAAVVAEVAPVKAADYTCL
jgi:hypothetical protein